MMNTMLIAGIGIVLLPFVGLFAFGCKMIGAKETTIIFVCAVLVVVSIAAGVTLIAVGLAG